MIEDIGFTNHFFENRKMNNSLIKKRMISNERGNKKLFTKDFVEFLLKPYYDKLINKFDQFLFIFNNNRINNEKTYILLASENNKLIMISTMTSHSHQIKYKKTKLENIIRIDDKFFDEIVNEYKNKKESELKIFIKESKNLIKPIKTKELKKIKIEKPNKIIDPIKKEIFSQKLKEFSKRQIKDCYSNSNNKIERKGLKKVIVEKPKSENKFKELYDLINSPIFIYFNELEKNKILKEQKLLYFYEDFDYIFNEDILDDFLKVYNKIKENIILFETGYIDLQYIDYIIEEINKYNDNKKSIKELKEKYNTLSEEEFNIIINSKLSYKKELEILNKIKSM